VNLVLQTETIGKVVVIRCQGRIVTGDETVSLQKEIERYSPITKKIVLQLAEVKYVDSGGLGALVRVMGTLRAQHGDLKLCQASSFVHQVLEATSLLKVFHTYASEKEAVDAFHESYLTHPPAAPLGATIVCVDPSIDLLAYLNVLLKRSGYEVITTKSVVDAKTLIKVRNPDAVVCGPGLQANEFGISNLRQSAPNAKFLMLSPEFSTTEASQAGLDLVERLRALIGPPRA